MALGATCLGQGWWRFVVWAPRANRVEVVLSWPRRQVVMMRRQARGYYEAVVAGVRSGARYFYRLDGQQELPDPASRSQPDGVHGASQALDHQFTWKNASWAGVPLEDYVLYEVHVGTYTPAGTFSGVMRRLRALRALGVTAIELMPVSQFPGSRNWG